MLPELFRDDVFRLETRRLWLRWPRLADAAALSALSGKGDASRPSDFLPHAATIEEAEAFVRACRESNASGEHLRLVATFKTGPRELIGMIGVEPHGETLGFSYWLGKGYCGQGYAGEAAATAIDAFFRFSRAAEIDALASEENAKSQAMLAKVGFRAVGKPETAGPAGGDPALRFALSRRDWQAVA